MFLRSQDEIAELQATVRQLKTSSASAGGSHGVDIASPGLREAELEQKLELQLRNVVQMQSQLRLARQCEAEQTGQIQEEQDRCQTLQRQLDTALGQTKQLQDEVNRLTAQLVKTDDVADLERRLLEEQDRAMAARLEVEELQERLRQSEGRTLCLTR